MEGRRRGIRLLLSGGKHTPLGQVPWAVHQALKIVELQRTQLPLAPRGDDRGTGVGIAITNSRTSERKCREVTLVDAQTEA